MLAPKVNGMFKIFQVFCAQEFFTWHPTLFELVFLNVPS